MGLHVSSGRHEKNEIMKRQVGACNVPSNLEPRCESCAVFCFAWAAGISSVLKKRSDRHYRRGQTGPWLKDIALGHMKT